LEQYSDWTPTDAVKAWADEEKCVSGQMCGHYTHIVWKSTRRIGCARVVCDDGDVFMTCNYDPVGNYVGERPY
ncbi:pathogenesis-related protein PR-1-like, partial [Trifolium medium]|nr:pathogenesis-related protein PR-1-like [Trifolium medium]